MRYVIVVVAALFCGLAWLGTWGAARQLDEAGDAGADGATAPVSSSSTYGESFRSRAAGEAPVFDDPLTAALYAILEGLAAGRVGIGDRKALEDRLVTAMRKAELGNDELRPLAARLAVDDLLKNAGRLVRGGGLPREDLMRGAAKAFAARLERQVPGLEISREHTGSILSPVLDPKLPAGVEPAAWALLSGFAWEEGDPLPPGVKKLDGRRVGIAGYMIPLGEFEDIHEFLLVESLWTCCFGVPPEVNQVIVVRIEDGGVELETEPVLVLGRLAVGPEWEDGFVTSVYRIHASDVRVLP